MYFLFQNYFAYTQKHTHIRCLQNSTHYFLTFLLINFSFFHKNRISNFIYFLAAKLEYFFKSRCSQKTPDGAERSENLYPNRVLIIDS